MKKNLFLTATLVMFLAFTVNAQHKGARETREKATPEQQASHMVERLNKELKLTSKQQADLKTWFTTSFKKRNELMEKNKDNRQGMREEMQKERTATDVQLKKVLTAEQYKTYKANEEKRMQERKQHQGQRQGGGHQQK